MNLAGQVALITGGASGLGKHLAHNLHSKGVTLIIADINDSGGLALVESFNQLRPRSAFFQKTDVTSWEDQIQLFKVAMQQVKRIDYVFPNAGIAESTYLPPTSSQEIEWVRPDLKTMDINLTGVLYTSTLAAQVFRNQSIIDGFRGKIIVTVSVAGFFALPYAPLYSTSKHALVGFIRSLAPQLASEYITVNGVAPNFTRTNIVPEETFDAIRDLGLLTSNEKVTETFLSFLGDCTDNGVIKEVSMEDTFVRPLPEPINPQETESVKFVTSLYQNMHAPPATAQA